jgi:hypothetical protein
MCFEPEERNASLGGLLQPSNRPEEVKCPESQVIVALVIQAALAQADLPETPGPRDASVFTAAQSLRSLLFSCRSISVHKAPWFEPSTAQVLR